MSETLEIVVNGEPQSLSQGDTIATLLAQMELTGKRVAVEVNETIVPRSQHQQYQLSHGDTVEVVQAIGGG